MTEPREPSPRSPSLRISPEERDRAITRLSDAYAHDFLALEELERRMDAVYSATTAADLARITQDLPDPAEGTSVNVTTAATLAPIRAVFANVERGGKVTLPRQMDIRATFSNVELDLSGAILLTGVTEIRIAAAFANVEIWLPTGVTVENRADAVLASIECRNSIRPVADPPASIVRISGRALLSNVEVTTG